MKTYKTIIIDDERLAREEVKESGASRCAGRRVIRVVEEREVVEHMAEDGAENGGVG